MDIQTIKGVVENLNTLNRAMAAMKSEKLEGKVEHFAYVAYKTNFSFQFLSPDAHDLFEKALLDEIEFEKGYLKLLIDSEEEY